MRRSALLASFVKELRLLARDVHGLALLFVLPLVFILVMSLALQDLFESRAGRGIGVLVIDRSDGEQSHDLYERLAANSAFSLSRSATVPDDDDMRRLLRGSANAFAIEIAADYETRIAELSTENTSPLVRVTAAADTGKQTELIFVAALQGAVERQRARLLMNRIGYLAPEGEETAAASRIAVSYAYASAGGQAPTAVQQNVPAWLVFALFFVAVPFSNSFIRERQVGAQKRLRTTNIGAFTQFLGKLAPYFLINQLQVALMLAAGVYLVPLLGGQALRLNGDFSALAMLSAVLSLAALGFALLIAVTARTTEQATLTAGLGNIVLAVIGGVMVPKFVMPEALQQIADLSPMSWGVDGFLELFLRGGGVVNIWPELAKLLAFGLAALVLARVLYRPQEQG
jgi:ABC-2 type transport system permease protein